MKADMDMKHKREAVDALIDSLSLISDPTEKELFIRKVSEEFKIDSINIIKSLNQRKKEDGKNFLRAK